VRHSKARFAEAKHGKSHDEEAGELQNLGGSIPNSNLFSLTVVYFAVFTLSVSANLEPNPVIPSSTLKLGRR
jgi:hypothetical protein